MGHMSLRVSAMHPCVLMSCHQAFVEGHCPLRSCRLPAHALTAAHCRSGNGARRMEGGGANCKFRTMLTADSTCHIRSKGQTKGYGPTVNHIKFMDPEINF